MLLTIIILNYKTSDLTKSCIESIYKAEGENIGRNIEIILVDNGSEKDEVKKLKDLRDKLGFKLITSEKNLGFGAGCNFGATMAGGDIFLFLNSDTEVSGGLYEMAKYLKSQEKVGILGGKLKKSDGSIEKSAGKFLNILHLILMLWGGERLGLVRSAPKRISSVDWVSGGCFMIKKKVFESLRGFDEDYFMYVEDMDLCLRAKKQGFNTLFYPDVSILHKEHGSSNRSFAITNIYKSLLIYYKKNKSKLEYDIAKNILKSKAFLKSILSRGEEKDTYKDVLSFFS